MKLGLLFLVIFSLVIQNCAALNSISTSSASLNSISTSLNSISTALNSVSSVSKSLASISPSSGSDDDKKASMYIRDVESITYLFLVGKLSDWETNLQELALSYGYMSWKETPASFIGIGKGLKKAQISEQDFKLFSKGLMQNSVLHHYINSGYK